MKIKTIKYKNFKYASPEDYVIIDFAGADVIIMGGSNGYGKTTVFDAIELLIMGKIKHFNADLPNKGKQNIAVLANDNSKDISIVIDFINDDEIITIERRFLCAEGFNSKLYINGEIKDNTEVFSILGINENLFSIGTYISQIDSLNFLQRKYKERKETITGILDNSNILNRLNEFKSVRSLLKSNYEAKYNSDVSNLNKLQEEINNISNKIEALNIGQENIEYKKLFENKNYIFDKEVFDERDSYEVVVSQINDLIEFAQYKESFFKKKRNIELDKILNIDKNVYMALYFGDNIDECKENREVIEIVQEILKVKKQYDERNFTLNKRLFERFNINTQKLEKLQILLEQKKELEQSISSTQESLTKLIRERSSFVETYKKANIDGVIPKDICPLCGRKSDELYELFSKTEVILKQNIGVIASQLTEIVKQILFFYENELFIKTDDYLNNHKRIIRNYNLLQSVSMLSTEELSSKLKKENLDFLSKAAEVDLNTFEEEYKKIIISIKSLKEEETEIINNELYDKLSNILLKYYTDKKIYSEELLIEKKAYISTTFFNTFTLELNKKKSDHLNLKNQIDKLKNRYKRMDKNLDTVIKKYDFARKIYESNIVKNIELPLYIYSGKIIQNYPLGLGIIIQVEENSVVFKTENLKNDIFNNLSTGQLNGVIISLLLAIKDIFSFDESLDTLLIDDPLQTLDDISAISFLDILLEHFNETQVILSTHEFDKQFLIKKKYEQLGKKCNIVNMQERYLEV